MNAKKIVSVLMAVSLMLIGVTLLNTPSVLAAEDESNDYTYSVTGGNATITGYAGGGGAITIPSEIDGYSVNAIGNYAFRGCSNLSSITILDSVTSIGYYAFYNCAGLTSIIIPDSVTSIGDYAFSGCTGLTSVHISDLAAWCEIQFGDKEFNGNGLANPLYYAKNLYLNGSLITELVIPDSVTSIGNYAFYNCTGLTSVTIADSVTSMGSGVFDSCTNLKKLIIADGSTTITSTMVVCADQLTEVVIPGSVTSIGDDAFSGCTGLTSITIPDSVTSVGSGAFEDCTGLTSITIPDSVTSVGGWAFDGCVNLTKLIVADGSTTVTQSMVVCTDQLTEVVIPGSVTSIGNYAFYKCTGLTSITIPDSVTSVGSGAFEDCTGLTSITIPDGVTSIGDYAFFGCRGLTNLAIGNGVTSIDHEAFYGCTSLTSVHITEIAVWCKIAFNSSYANPLYYAENLYLNGSLVTDLVIPDSVTSIGYYAFYNCTGLTSIIIPDSVTSVGDYAFYNCTGLTSIIIPDSVTSVGDYAFYNCTGLTSVTIGDGVTSIGDVAFCNCAGLTSVTIGDSVTNIGNYAFSHCTGLTSIIIPGNLTYIGTWAFYDCTGLTSVVFGNGVTSIDHEAFSGCAKLTSITIPDSVKSVSDYAFFGCTNLTKLIIADGSTTVTQTMVVCADQLTEVIISNSVTCIDYNAFYNCTDLTSITIPDSVTSVGGWAFDGCVNLTKLIIADGSTTVTQSMVVCTDQLTEVVIPGSVTSIGDYAFSGCTGLTSITIPDSVTSIGESAFSGCTSLSNITIGTGVTSCGNNAFTGCTALEKVHIRDMAAWCEIEFGYGVANPLYYAKNLYLNGSLVTDLVIPDGTMRIGSRTFSNCTWLTSVTIPDSVTSIGSWAFSGCTGLTNLAIGNGVTSIDYEAFYGCTGLTSIIIPGNVTNIDNSAFYGCTGLTSITIGNGVTSIGGYAFYGCTGLTSITIPDSVTSVGESAFEGCSSLTKMTLPFVGGSATEDSYLGYIFGADDSSSYIPATLNTVILSNKCTNIGDYAFYNCTGLTSVTIPDSVTSIGEYAFLGCTGLTSITIPDSVTSIGYVAFEGCTGLTSVHISDLAAWCEIEFGYGVANPLYYAKNLYLNGSLVSDLVIPDGVISIGNYAFYGCTGLTSVIISDSVTSIGGSAFEGCNSLTKITLPFVGGSATENTYLGYIFGANGSNHNSSYIPVTLNTVILSTKCTSIGDDAFEGCTGLTNITIPDGVMSIGDRAFYRCTGLTRVTIPDSVTIIGNSAFFGCTGLKQATLGNGVKEIGQWAFENCINLTSVVIPESLITVDNGAFNECLSLSDIWYRGDEEDRKKVYINSVWNTSFTDATWHYNACLHTPEHTYDDMFDLSCSVCGDIRYVESVSVKLPKYIYKVDEVLPFNEAQLTFYYDNHTGGTVALNAGMVSGFDGSIIGTQTFTITYEGVSTSVTVQVVPFNGSGTEDDPFIIESAYHLDCVRYFPFAHFKQVKDIIFTDSDFAVGGNFYHGGAGWQPIGKDYDGAFLGTFDGNGYTIKNLQIYANALNTDCYIGLFGYNCGIIRNVKLENVSIFATLTQSTSVENIEGGYVLYVGGIAGYSHHRYSYDESAEIINCYVSGEISAVGQNCSKVYAGGIGGHAEIVMGCGNESSVSAANIHTDDSSAVFGNASAGGIIGLAYAFGSDGVISKCYNTGDISATVRANSKKPDECWRCCAGGIFGEGGAMVTFCYNTGRVTSDMIDTLAEDSNAGGVGGFFYGGIIENCYNLGAVSATNKAGGICGRAGTIDCEGEIYRCYNIGPISAIYDGGIVGWYLGNESNIVAVYYLDTAMNGIGKYFVLEFTDSDAVKSTEIQEDPAKIVRCTTEEMKKAATFAKFQFDEVWTMGGDTNYPYPELVNVPLNFVDAVNSITIATKPSKQTYIEGTTLDTAGMTLTVVYKSGRIETITTGWSCQYDFSAPGTATVTVIYQDVSTTFTVTVQAKALTSIELTTLPSDLSYLEGKDTLDVTGGKVTLYYNNGTSEEIDLIAAMVSGFDNSKVGAQPITVTYGGFTDTYSVTVVAKSLTSIAVTTKPTKLTYLEGDAFDKNGMVVTAYYNNGTSEPVTGYAVSGYDSTPGTKTITVAYGGKTATFTVTVTAKTLTSIAVTTKPTKLSYIEGTELDDSGMVLTLYYNNGTSDTIRTGWVSEYDFSVTGTRQVEVTYGGKTCTYSVTVVKKSLASIAIQTPPNKLVYLEGDSFDTTGLSLIAYYDNGTHEIITSNWVVTGYNSVPGTKTITVTYGGKTTTFSVTVNAKALTSIAVTKKPSKLVYTEGENFSSAGMVVTAYYNNGTHEAVSGYSVSGYTSTVGTKMITVSYGGKSDSFTVVVNAKPTTTTTTTTTTKKPTTSTTTTTKPTTSTTTTKPITTTTTKKPTTTTTTKPTVSLTRGDANGDNKVTITDMIAIKAHVLKKSTLTGNAAKAADTNGDGKITITDFIQVKSHLLGKSKL